MSTSEINQKKLRNIVVNIIKKERDNVTTKKKKELEMIDEICKVIKDEIKLKY